MSTVKKEDVIDFLSGLTVLELSNLSKELEEKWGVTAAVAAAPAASGAGAAAVEEKTSFDVVLKGAGANKIAVIKVVREITGLGLAEAKALAETAGGTIKAGVDKATADKHHAQLKEAGADVEIK